MSVQIIDAETAIVHIRLHVKGAACAKRSKNKTSSTLFQKQRKVSVRIGTKNFNLENLNIESLKFTKLFSRRRKPFW